MLILDDYFGVKLWGENIFRLISKHFIRNDYLQNTNPLLYGPLPLLDTETLMELQSLELPDPSSGKWNGYSSSKRTLHYNDLTPELQVTMTELGLRLMPTFATIGRLVLGEHSTIVRYEGPATKFDIDYEMDDPESFVCLVLYRGSGKHQSLSFQNNCIPMNEGEGILFRGDTQYHGLFPTNHDETLRYVLMFQYHTIRTKTLRSELRGKSAFEIARLFMPYIVYYQCISRLIPYEIPMALIPCFFHMGMHTPNSFMRLYACVFLCTFKPVYALFICSYLSI
jgi:hypothetical protein